MPQLIDRRRPVGDRAAPSPLTHSWSNELSASRPWDIAAIRADFPILSQQVHGQRLVWLDNAATTQKPRAVIQRLVDFYERENANIHRSGHSLGDRATAAYEGARATVRRFLNAPTPDSVVFVRGTTEAVNLVASSWGPSHVNEDDEIVISWLEHSSNIVPWQQLAQQRRARLRVVPIDERGQIDFEQYERLLTPRTRIVALTHVSNALGTVLPLARMIAAAHERGAVAFVDGAQAAAHLPIDVQALDADFYAFSGHKVFGPTGIGALYARPGLLASATPWQFGGHMVSTVSFADTTFRGGAARFEAGTGHIAGAVGLAAALDYLSALDREALQAHEQSLTQHARVALSAVPGLRLIGDADDRIGVLSFVVDGWPPEVVGDVLDRDGIAVRAGNHCAQPALSRFGYDSSIRASLALYNTKDDVDALAASLTRLVARGAKQS